MIVRLTSAVGVANWKDRESRSARKADGKSRKGSRFAIFEYIHSSTLRRSKGRRAKKVSFEFTRRVKKPDAPDLNKASYSSADDLDLEHDARRDLHVWRKRGRMK